MMAITTSNSISVKPLRFSDLRELAMVSPTNDEFGDKGRRFRNDRMRVRAAAGQGASRASGAWRPTVRPRESAGKGEAASGGSCWGEIVCARPREDN
jgi:hypothetical protein